MTSITVLVSKCEATTNPRMLFGFGRMGQSAKACGSTDERSLSAAPMAPSSKATCFALFLLASVSPSVAAPAQPLLPQSFSKTPSASVNYADVRARVANAFAEKAYEMSAMVAVLQTLSKETSSLVETIHAHCGAKMEVAPKTRQSALRG